MTNGNDSATGFAYSANQAAENGLIFTGLTKREYFAAMAMQGLLSNVTVFNGEIQGNHSAENLDFVCKESAYLADALIKALNETQQ